MKSKIGDITLLQISNLRCIRFVNLEFDPESGQLIKLAGPNDSGKSTILDALKYAFEGAAAIPKGVIRNGLYTEGKLAGKPIDRANIRVETDTGYVIERVIRTDKHGEQIAELTITKEGEGKLPSAQSFLDDISTRYPDPTEIAALSGKELFRAIVDILDINLDEIDEKIAEHKQELQVLRRQKKALGATPAPPSKEKVEPQSYDTLSKNYQKSLAMREEAKKKRAEASELSRRIKQLEEELENTRNEWHEANREANQAEEIAPDQNELAELEKQINEIDEHNKLATQWQEYERLAAEHERVAKQIEEQTAARDALLTQRKERLTQTPLPASLFLEDENVWQQTGKETDVSWDSLSTSAKLTASTLLAIQSIPDGAPRYLYVHRGESLGSERRQEIARLARENHTKVFLEVMREDPEDEAGAIIVQQGEVHQPAEKQSVDTTNSNHTEIPSEPTTESSTPSGYDTELF